jgi:solute carrier family 35 protein E1
MAPNTNVVLLILVWYGASVFAIMTSKMVMQEAPLPFSLCMMQFLVATFVSGAAILLQGGWPKPIGPEFSTLGKTSLSYTLGFMLTNVGFSLLSAPFVETVKSSEPITTVLLASFFLGEVDSLRSYLSLIPIILGVAAASMSFTTTETRDL